MISIDSTAQDTAPTRNRDRRYDNSTCGYCKKRVPKGHECAQKREAMKERPCEYAKCGKPFKPEVYGQRYCCHNHKRMNRNAREYANKLKRLAKADAAEKRAWPKPGFKSDINTIAPLERQWARASENASRYAPLMGDALYATTMRLMRAG